MSTPAQFIDYTDAEFNRHERAQESRAALALRRNAGASVSAGALIASVITTDPDTSDPTPTVLADRQAKRLAADYGQTTASANFLLAGAKCPPEHRAFIDAIVGVAGGRAEFFTASDETIARHVGRSSKWVQMHRRELLAWQTSERVTLIEIEDNYRDADGAHHAHRYRVHLARFAAESTIDARLAPDYGTHPGKALEAAALTYRDSLPTMQPRKRRKRDRQPDAATEISRALKYAATLIDKALAVHQLCAGRVEIDPAQIAALRAQVAALDGSGDGWHVSSMSEESMVEVEQVEKSSTMPTPVEPPKQVEKQVEKSSTMPPTSPETHPPFVADTAEPKPLVITRKVRAVAVNTMGGVAERHTLDYCHSPSEKGNRFFVRHRKTGRVLWEEYAPLDATAQERTEAAINTWCDGLRADGSRVTSLTEWRACDESPPAELTYEPDADELAEREAIRAEAFGEPLDDTAEYLDERGDFHMTAEQARVWLNEYNSKSAALE